MMNGVLAEYSTLVTRAQYVKQPISPLIARQCLRMDGVLRKGYLKGTPLYAECYRPGTTVAGSCGHQSHRRFPQVYTEARKQLLVAKPDVVRAVDKLGEQVVTCLLDDFWTRLKDSGSHAASNPLGISLWDLLLACELADPTAHDETFDVPDKTLHAVHLICDRFGIVDKEACMNQIELARGLCHGPHKVITDEQQELSKSNLLAFFCRVYGENYGADNGANTEHGMAQWKELPIYAQFVKAVFSIMISSAVVEALFNKYSYAKNRFRSSMLDGTAASILSTQELEDLIGNVKKPFAAFFELRSVALTDKLNWT
jgi:hypothetical protein